MITASNLCLAGWLLLALAMPSHQRQLLKRVTQPWFSVVLRIIGSLLLISSVYLLNQHYSASIAIMMWLMLLTITAFFPLLMLSFAHRRFYFASIAITIIIIIIGFDGLLAPIPIIY